MPLPAHRRRLLLAVRLLVIAVVAALLENAGAYPATIAVFVVYFTAATIWLQCHPLGGTRNR